MADDVNLEELEKVKQFWKKYGKQTIFVALVVLTITLGWNYWSNQQIVTIHQASSLYQAAVDDDAQGTFADAKAKVDQLTTEYSNTIYSQAVLLISAKNALQNDNYAEAVEQYKKILSESEDVALRQTTQILHLRAMLDHDFDNLINTLNSYLKNAPATYHSQYNYIKGVALLKTEDFAGAYQAFIRVATDNSLPRYLQIVTRIQLDDLAGYAESGI